MFIELYTNKPVEGLYQIEEQNINFNIHYLTFNLSAIRIKRGENLEGSWFKAVKAIAEVITDKVNNEEYEFDSTTIEKLTTEQLKKICSIYSIAKAEAEKKGTEQFENENCVYWDECFGKNGENILDCFIEEMEKDSSLKVSGRVWF